MSSFAKRFSIGVFLCGASVLLLGMICYAIGLRINTTKSIPVGLYRVSDDPVEKGIYVVFCPPQISVFDDAKNKGYIGAGFCPGGYGYMMKRVVAANNDTVVTTDEGVYVNGKLLPLSTPLKSDSSGFLLPRYQSDNFTLGNSELLLMSDVSGTSFDGRYFGPINRSQIKNVIRPIFTW